MDLKIGPNSHEYARNMDENMETCEARIRHRLEQNDALDIAGAASSLLYGAGIDNSMQV